MSPKKKSGKGRKSNHSTIAVKFGTKKLVARAFSALRKKDPEITSYDDVVSLGCKKLLA